MRTNKGQFQRQHHKGEVCVAEGCNNEKYAMSSKVDKHCISCRHLWAHYKITTPQRDRMITEQQNKCGICEIELTTSTHKAPTQAVVDHCHSTGKIRGILCNQCNRAIGLLGDTAHDLQKAVNYLKG